MNQEKLKFDGGGSPLRIQHPFLLRLVWNPLVVAVPFAYLAYMTYLLGFPIARSVGTAVVGLWFGLSVCDMITGHRVLDWLYSDEERRARQNWAVSNRLVGTFWNQ